MREIKFRVWSNQLNKMVYPNERGWFDKCFIGKNQFIQSCQLSLAIEKNGKELEVMQYTGLRDKNGTEIYEGDLLFDKDELTRPFIVKWDDEWAQFYVDCGGGSTDFLWRWTNLEVIGNIFQDGDLLRDSQSPKTTQKLFYQLLRN
jgi:hypothetical protein